MEYYSSPVDRSTSNATGPPRGRVCLTSYFSIEIFQPKKTKCMDKKSNGIGSHSLVPVVNMDNDHSLPTRWNLLQLLVVTMLLSRGEAFSLKELSSSSSRESFNQRCPPSSASKRRRPTTNWLTLLALSHPSPSDYFGDPVTVAASIGSSSTPPTTTQAFMETTTPPSTSTTTTTTTVAPSGTVQRLRDLSEFLHFIDSAPTNSLVVVKFFGHSCPLCRKIEIKYKKMARFYGSAAPIQFAEIEKRAHPALFTTLGIESFPYLQIYRNGQCVASHGTESDITFEPIVKDTIERELLMSLEDWNAFLTAFAAPIQASTAKLEQLRNLLSAA